MVIALERNPELDGITSRELLWQWLRFGWDFRKIGDKPKAEQEWYAARVRREMAMIESKDLFDFFLFTSDVIRWAKDHDIPIGPGRGSTAASLVAYLLRITEVDPRRYPAMMFERFLDETRHDPPDIDVDCSDERRHEVYNYIARKYGPECVGHIGNFVGYKAKNSLQDVARVYNVPPWARETIGNMAIERSGGDSRADATLTDTFAMFAAAQEVLKLYPDLAKAARLEGDIRGMSVHACGLMVANTPLTNICAVYEKDGERVLSIDKIDAEYVGALKLDFLGLSTMGMIARCLEMTGLSLADLYAIPDTDRETIDVFRRNDVIGVFQFEGRATRLVCRDVEPEHFGHITDINALSRPGPLFSGQTAEYVEVRHGRKAPTPLHPIVDRITAHTYGQMIYQEHILACLKEVGDLAWTNVHHIRRIIAKKAGQAAFQQSFDAFAEGAAKLHGIDRELAEAIWLRLVTSGTYAFNVAHAVSYSLLAFWTAWLKAHHPLEFYAASLAKAGSAEAQFRLMRDAMTPKAGWPREPVKIEPPSPSLSRATWRPYNGTLQAGWSQIPKIGIKTAERLDAAAELKGGFSSWAEVGCAGVGDKTRERMARWSGSRDPFGLFRTEKRLAATKRFIRTRKDIPNPTHDGDQLAAIKVAAFVPGQPYIRGPWVVYAGVVGKVEYKDIVEDERSRTGREAEEILAELSHQDLVKRATLHMYDAGTEMVFARVNRFAFPDLRRQLETIRPNQDVVVIAGNRIGGFGTPVKVKRIWVIDPEV